MAERTDPPQKTNHPFYYQYRAVYEYATQFTHAQRVLDSDVAKDTARTY